ncbi:MAG: efflux RND transporter periplasmic adaptor subunit, partial [Muribaculaceae bacterium]|nr:efflux RND transporter periplasmic adaptor subunit [Muribaculaceae bacterium]
MKKFFLPGVIAIAITASCSSNKEDSSKQQAEAALPKVKVETVEQRQVDQIGTYTATVQPQILNNISSAIPGRIKEILVDEGQQVSAGQTVAILDDVNTFSYETQVDNARANLKNVQLNYDRAVELFNIGGGTKQQVDAMEIQLTNAKNALAQAERTLRNARENTILTSPIAGVVTARNYDPGDMAANLPIVTVARVNPVKLVINVTETDFPKIRKGMPATIKFDTYGDE